jgi:site-specific DNA recombinase
MRRAVLYARVSSDLQKKEQTIDSQLAEIKKQISNAGDVLVKEYIDEGVSGTRFYRPALDQLRRDLKTNLFDAIYLWDVDRLAREAAYQNVIVAEMLKYRKSVVIKGKDYVENPENKFMLNMLGSMAEFERTKIIERTVRARQYRIAQGILIACGNNIYGYDYHRRTPTSAPYYTINETEAAIVRQVFETYAKETIGMCKITRQLETQNAPTKYGRNIWRVSLLKCMLRNEMYLGIRYFNTMKTVREYANPIYDIKHSTRKLVKRPREDWVGVKVPAIITKALFDNVQERLAWNKQHYRNPKKVQLLSSLIRCGKCGGGFFAYRRYYTDKRMKTPRIYHRVSYKCNKRHHAQMHVRIKMAKCMNPEINAAVIEYHVFEAIKQSMLDPVKLRSCMDFFKGKTRVANVRVGRRLKRINETLKELDAKKQRLVELYAAGSLEQKRYIENNLVYDGEINALASEHDELMKQIPLLHKTDAVDTSIRQYCEAARIRFDKCTDFETKRQFLLEHVEKVVYEDDKFTVCGSVPMKHTSHDDGNQPSDASKIAFKISGAISTCERLSRSNAKKELYAKRGFTPTVTMPK